MESPLLDRIEQKKRYKAALALGRTLAIAADVTTEWARNVLSGYLDGTPTPDRDVNAATEWLLAVAEMEAE